jgi:phospholipid transport system substrate-binding protein
MKASETLMAPKSTVNHETMKTFSRPLAALALAAALSTNLVPTVHAAIPDPAAERINTLDNALLDAMKQGPALGVKGRYRKLSPVIDQSFDLPTMTAYAVGPAWAGFAPADKQALIRAFGRLSAASYAHNFDSFSGERFEVGAVQQRGADKVVLSKIVPAHGDPTSLSYRMRQTAEGWKIIDVYYGAISQLTTRRSDFAGPVASGGAKGLLAHLDTLTAKLVG